MQMRPFICAYDDCDKSYSTSSHLHRHELSHEGNVKCTQKDCKRTFKNKYFLKKHIDVVHLKKKPKKYKCSECGEEFNKHNWLTRHQYKHTNVKPYVCSKEGCDKSFLLPSKLKRHMKMHEGYACTKENCKEVFSTWTLYRKHVALSHPNIYKCQYCEKPFTRPCQLKSHMEMHKSERKLIPCPKPNCSRFYTSQHILNDHIKSYHDKRPFVCPIEHCYKAYKTEDDLTAHHSLHFRRIRRKKKKGRPSFATKLAGLAPKKWQTELVSGDEKTSAEDSLSEAERSLENSELDNSKEEFSITNNLEEAEVNIAQDIYEQTNLEAEVNTSESDGLCNLQINLQDETLDDSQILMDTKEVNTSESDGLCNLQINLQDETLDDSQILTDTKEVNTSGSDGFYNLQINLQDETLDDSQILTDTKEVNTSGSDGLCNLQINLQDETLDDSQILTDTSCLSAEVSDVELFCEILCNDGKIRHFPDLLPFNLILN